jgi:tetratricopeptide (TPR) repeat protein
MICYRIVLAAMLCLLYAEAGYSTELQPAEETDDLQAEVLPSAATDSSGSKESMDEEVMFRVMSAEMRGNDGDMEGAVGDYLAAAMESDDPAVAMRATRVAFAAQAWLEASMAADRWALLDPKNISAHESAAMAMLATADYAGAELHLRRLLELSPDKESAWSSVANLLGRSASPEKASRVLQSLLESLGAEDNAAGAFAQSQLSIRTGDFDQAYVYANKAVELSPEKKNYLLLAGQLARKLGKDEQALEFTRKALDLSPGDHDLTLAYADLLARTGKPQAARDVMAGMVQTPDVMLSRILFELAADDRAAALGLYEQFRNMEFEDPMEKAFFLGQSADAQGLYQDAVDSFANIQNGQYFLAATARRAELQAELGDIEGARGTLAILRTRAEPTIVMQSWLTEAQILQRAGQKEAAVEALTTAIGQMSNSAALHYSRALVAAEIGEVALAESDLLLVLAQDPENAAALNALGYTLADQTDRLDEAEAYIRRAYELLPEDAAITDSMGWVAYRKGRLQEAELYLRKAWEMDTNPEIAAHLGEVLWFMDRQEEAREIWGIAQDSGPENEVLQKTIERLQP